MSWAHATAAAMATLLATSALPARAADLQIRDAYSPLSASRPVRAQTRYVVLHTTEGGDASAEREVRRRGLANYLVLRDGTVLRVVAKDREARHAGLSMWHGVEDLDRISVGIEVVGYHDQPITAAQEQALRELLRQLKSLYPLGDDAVLAHAMVAYGQPNQWHDHPHRGRKRCGMLFAGLALRERIGLAARPAFDPDVVAGRLVEGDAALALALYGRQIAAGQTAAEVAGEAWRAATTIYVLPGGEKVRGDQDPDWTNLPAGTWVVFEPSG